MQITITSRCLPLLLPVNPEFPAVQKIQMLAHRDLQFLSAHVTEIPEVTSD
jgi:hypothetical protein